MCLDILILRLKTVAFVAYQKACVCVPSTNESKLKVKRKDENKRSEDE